MGTSESLWGPTCNDQAGASSATIRFYRATGTYGFLSMLFRRPIMFEGRVFDCGERAFQFGKPSDPAVAEWLVAAPKPHLCAAAAHALFRFDVHPEWTSRQVPRMRRVVRAKYTQHLDLAQRLLDTGDAILIEASGDDPEGLFWGEGKRGKGKNTLGVVQMEFRGELAAASNAGGSLAEVLLALADGDTRGQLCGTKVTSDGD